MVEFTRPQKEIQKAAREFARGEFDRDLAREFEQTGTFPKSIWKKAADLGFIGIHFPENHSGGGLGFFENTIIAETLCMSDSSMGCALLQSAHGAECISMFGKEEQKARFLSKIAEGELISSGAFVDPAPAKKPARAIKKNDTWIINGTKTYVPNGGAAGLYIVSCITDPGKETYENTSMILVEADREGIAVQTAGRKLGGNMTTTAALTFRNVQVPAKNLLGREGKGVAQLEKINMVNRISLAGQALGIARGALDRVLDYVKQREQFGRKIARFQITCHKVAEMATKVELARLITYGAAGMLDTGKADSKTTAMAKMVATRAAVEVADEAIQLLGGYGYMSEYEVERFYRDAKALDLSEGSCPVLKDIIGTAVMGRIR
jgi:alkylation response protein AidB-like acyl-CoA dehydrogenase